MNVFVFASSSTIYLLYAMSMIVLFYIGFRIKIIPDGKQAVIERFGVFYRVTIPGLNYLVPMIDKVKPTYDLSGNKTILIDVTKQSFFVSPNEMMTKDNHKVLLFVEMVLQVNDSKQYAYSVTEQFTPSITRVLRAALQEILIQLDKSEVYRSYHAISSAILSEIQDKLRAYGIEIHEIIVGEE
ncbi:MAG: SPFH domain-containing protein [Candidatus Izemoplasmatales bacterium]